MQTATSKIGIIMMLIGLIMVPQAWAQGASLSGTVTDADDGGPLPGANVVLVGTTYGAASDLDGNYTIASIPPGEYMVRITYIGYQETQMPLTLAAGESRTLDIALTQAGFDLNTVVITASRRQEKALDAPASVSVISAEAIAQDVGTSSVEALRNTTGVDMAQTGIDRREVVLRGFNNAFSGAAFVLTDYRQAAVPSLGVNIYSIMPNMNIDVDRIEVVRGPGSALYGPGVDAGVIHFITKDPFSHPGAQFTMGYGTRGYASVQGRIAGTAIDNQLGFKVTGQYGGGDDWELDPNDPIDATQIAIDGQRDNRSRKRNINGTLEFRPQQFSNVSLIANAGYSDLDASVLSGIGTLQALNFGYSYGQLRLQASDFFAQFFFNNNSAGDSFVYDSSGPRNVGTTVVDKGVVYNGQAQYDWFLSDRQNFIIGADIEITRPDTEGTILGRNEDDDSITEYGAYVQSTTGVTSALDITVALRGDYNNIIEAFQLSPRAAVVFKPSLNHTLRATYNYAFSSPGVNSLFLDIVAGQIPGTGILIRGRGAAQGYTWERNPTFAAIAGTDLVASSLNPAALGAPTPVGLPLDLTYASVYSGLAALGVPNVTALLQAQGLPVNEAIVGGLLALLDPSVTQVQGFSRGQLQKLNLSTLTFDPAIDDLQDIVPLDQTTTQTIEVGYKGVFASRVLFTVDAYYTQKKDFVGPLLVETPFVTVPNLQTDLAQALAAGISNNPTLAGQLALLGLDAQTVAGLITGLAASSLPDANTPVAIVQPAQNNTGFGNTPELMLSYRNFGQVDFWGLDASFEFLASDALSVFGNVSFVSDDFFDNEELEETNTALSIALNSPTFKTKLGGSYAWSGFTGSLSGRYIEGFPVQSGPYVGDIESYFLLDLNLGYEISEQVDFSLGINNLLDNERREFIGAPKIGRMVIGRLTYDFK